MASTTSFKTKSILVKSSRARPKSPGANILNRINKNMRLKNPYNALNIFVDLRLPGPRKYHRDIRLIPLGHSMVQDILCGQPALMIIKTESPQRIILLIKELPN